MATDSLIGKLEALKLIGPICSETRHGREHNSTVDACIAIVRQHQAEAVCPYVVTSDEGSSYCRLAEQNGPPPVRASGQEAAPKAIDVISGMSDAEITEIFQLYPSLATRWKELLQGSGQEAEEDLETAIGHAIQYGLLEISHGNFGLTSKEKAIITRYVIAAMGEWHSADSSLKGTAKSIQCESESPANSLVMGDTSTRKDEAVDSSTLLSSPASDIPCTIIGIPSECGPSYVFPNQSSPIKDEWGVFHNVLGGKSSGYPVVDGLPLDVRLRWLLGTQQGRRDNKNRSSLSPHYPPPPDRKGINYDERQGIFGRGLPLPWRST